MNKGGVMAHSRKMTDISDVEKIPNAPTAMVQ